MIEKGYGATLVGRSHIKLKLPNQDSYLVSNHEKYTLAVVCDGLGSKKYSHIGSRKLCKVIDNQINRCFKKMSFEMDAFISKIHRKWKRSLWPIQPDIADCTCIFTVVGETKIIMCQIGDGLCVTKCNDSMFILSEKNDDFSNETTTFHKGRIMNWKIRVINKKGNEKYKTFICTDGISEDIKRDFLNEFVDELANSVTENSKFTNNPDLSDILKNWPNKYSNDDKTMVVIK